MWAVLQRGQRYAAQFPRQPKLALWLRDYQMIRWVRFAVKTMPAFVCFLACWHYFTLPLNQEALSSTVLVGAFALSLPIQGFYFLGVRAQAPLRLNLLEWYQRLRLELVQADCVLPNENTLPTYGDLVALLVLAEKKWGSAYFDAL